MNLADLRRDYRKAALDESHVAADPLAQFRRWMDEALKAEIDEPNAMALATATPDGAPSVRMVLLKGYDQRGFSFFTDYRSQKGRELGLNPRAEACIFWKELERQVRVRGTVEKLSRTESALYFASRPIESCLSAWASIQTAILAGRQELEQQVDAARARFRDQIPLPTHWGGFRIVPTEVEFWQGRPSRLHDRLRFRRAGEGWELVRLAP
ncbi:MAG: pyridoxamine 5'-phosphate oxidase [Planctomycetes bacterium]|nr:pyridoxamine 5'-phosphate oxidase [Planctomycetota bacterium]